MGLKCPLNITASTYYFRDHSLLRKLIFFTTKELNNLMKGLIDIQIEDSDKDNFLLIKGYVKIKEKNKISIKVLVCEDKTSCHIINSKSILIF